MSAQTKSPKSTAAKRPFKDPVWKPGLDRFTGFMVVDGCCGGEYVHAVGYLSNGELGVFKDGKALSITEGEACSELGEIYRMQRNLQLEYVCFDDSARERFYSECARSLSLPL